MTRARRLKRAIDLAQLLQKIEGKKADPRYARLIERYSKELEAGEQSRQTG